MKIIYILRDYTFEDSHLFHLGERVMSRVRLGRSHVKISGNLQIPVQFPETGRILKKSINGELPGIHSRPKAPWAPEIRDTRFGADTRPGKSDNISCLN